MGGLGAVEAGYRRHVEAPVGPGLERLDLAVRGIEEDEHLEGRIEAVDDSVGGAARVEVSLVVQGQGQDVRLRAREHGLRLALGVDPIDPALRPRGHEQVARLVEGQGPDVLVAGIEEGSGLAARVHRVDFPVRRGGHVKAAVRPQGQGVHLQLRGIEEERALAPFDLEDLPLVARAHVEGALGVGGHTPHRRHLGVVEDAGCGREADAPLGVDGEALHVALQEVPGPLDLPELRLGRVEERGREQGDHQGEGRPTRHETSGSGGIAADGRAHRSMGIWMRREPETA